MAGARSGVSSVSDIVPADVYREITQAGQEYYDRQCDASQAELIAKTIRHEQFLVAKQRGCTVPEAEAAAYVAKDHQEAMTKAHEAKRAEGYAATRYKAAQTLWEAQRTAEASYRAAARAAT